MKQEIPLIVLNASHQLEISRDLCKSNLIYVRKCALNYAQYRTVDNHVITHFALRSDHFLSFSKCQSHVFSVLSQIIFHLLYKLMKLNVCFK